MFFIPFVLFFTSSQLTLNMVNDKLRHMPEHQRSEGEALLTVISLVYVSLWPTLSDKHSLFVYHQKTNPTQPNPTQPNPTQPKQTNKQPRTHLLDSSGVQEEDALLHA